MASHSLKMKQYLQSTFIKILSTWCHSCCIFWICSLQAKRLLLSLSPWTLRIQVVKISSFHLLCFHPPCFIICSWDSLNLLSIHYYSLPAYEVFSYTYAFHRCCQRNLNMMCFRASWGCIPSNARNLLWKFRSLFSLNMYTDLCICIF